MKNTSQFRPGSLAITLDGASPPFVLATMATDTCIELVGTTNSEQIATLLEALQERAEEILAPDTGGILVDSIRCGKLLDAEFEIRCEWGDRI